MIRQNFNADWTVEKGDGNSRMNSFLGNTQTKTVHLPYDAMIHEARTPDTKNGAQTGFYPGGEYIFQKHFTAPQAWQGKPVSLVFEGVYQTALVYLNGWLLTRNVNGYAEFTVEAGPYLKYGADNLLKVIADNSLEPNSRWYTGSGIYRPVRLLMGNKVYLPQDTVRITPREADEGFALLDVTAQVQSASTVTERMTLQQTICREGTAVLTDRQNLLLQPGESRTVSFRYCVDSPALWSPENPNLYTSTMQVLENGQVVLVRLEGVTPVKALPYETARNSARADLLESMTVESMNKAAAELNTELQKAEKPVEQFNAIAGKAGAKTAAYGPFINPNALLSSVNLQNARSQEELQALLDRAMNSRLAPPKELPVPEEVFQAVSVINPGRMAQPINTGDGILLTQLVKRELEDTPEFQIKATQQIAPALTAQAKSMIMLDWLKACIAQYKVEIAPILNQER